MHSDSLSLIGMYSPWQIFLPRLARANHKKPVSLHLGVSNVRTFARSHVRTYRRASGEGEGQRTVPQLIGKCAVASSRKRLKLQAEDPATLVSDNADVSSSGRKALRPIDLATP